MDRNLKLLCNMKRISILIVLLVTTTLVSIGQVKSTFIGLIGSIEYNKYDFKKTMLNSNFDYNSNIGYSTGVGLKFQLQEKIFIKTGLLYATQGYQLKYNYVVLDTNDPAIPSQTKLKLLYLHVPIMFGYQCLNFGNFKFTPSGGLIIGYQINETENTTYDDGSIRKSDFLNQNLNKLQVRFEVALGFEYLIGDKFKIEIGPFIGKGLNKLDDELMKSCQIAYGLILGLYYKF